MNETTDNGGASIVAPRYAIYFTPAVDSPLGEFGASWMGRNPITHEPRPRPVLDGVVPNELAAAIKRPASYGFHATFKAPFYMKEGRDREGLVSHLTKFAAERAVFELPGLRPTALGAFAVLISRKRVGAVDSLAADCMRSFDGYRAHLTEHERERRVLATTLSERQLGLLDTWGYPFVLDQFDFHMTLAGPVDSGIRDRIVKALTRQFRDLWKAPVPVDGIALFEQEPGEAFRLTERFAFGA